MNDFDFYPEKPVIKTKNHNNNWALTFSSIVLFIATFLMLFEESFNFVLFLILILLIHEFGHFLCMKVFQYKNVKMLFVPLMGAFVQGEKSKYSQKQSLLVALAGPLPGMVIGVLLTIISYSTQSIELLQLGLMFYLLNVFNLLPLDPLDGGQLVRYLIIARSDILMFVFSLVSSLFMIFIGIYLDSYLIMGFGFLMGIRVRAIQKKINLYKMLDEEGLEYSKSYDDLTDKEYHLLRRYSIENTPMLKKYYNLTDDIDENFIAKYVKSILRVPVQLDLGLFGKISIVFLWLLFVLIIPILIYFSIQNDLIDLSWIESVFEF